MKLSEAKHIFKVLAENGLYGNWTLKQNVNDFLEYVESFEDVKAEWNRTSQEQFPFCLEELFKDYFEEFGEDEEEVEYEYPLAWEEIEYKMMMNEYRRAVAP